MEAILLVGGQGTRLRPLTENVPKPMLQVAGIPCTEHQIVKVQQAGATRIILATSYLAEVFEPYFGDGSRFGVELVYAVEDEPLGTGGAIANAGQYLHGEADDIVIILNGDILSGHDLAGQCALHRDRGADVTLHLTQVEDARNFGCVPIDESGRVSAFLEKMDEPITNLINAGCYTFSAGVIRNIPRGRVVSVERETFPDLLANNAKVFGFVDDSYWLDLGTPQAYLTGSCDVVTGRFPSPAYKYPPAECVVMDGAMVGVGSQLLGGSSINPGAVVGDGATIDASVILSGARIGDGAVIRNAIIGADAVIGSHAVIEGPGTCIGDGTHISDGEQVLPGTLLSKKS
jgi:mannose-1-phosphate guanylyltransferase